MKTIKVSLSVASIERAIDRLIRIQENLQQGLEDTVDILCQEGAGIANDSYQGMAVAIGASDQGVGTITSTGEVNLIAEFGAGDDTQDPTDFFTHAPHTDVFPGSYSLEVGSGEYWEKGEWHFGGRTYHTIPPRMGLWNAKNYVIEHSSEVAREVIKL